MKKQKATQDAVKILYDRYYADDPRRQAELEAARVGARVAREIYELRKKAGISQRELAARVGTTASVVSRLENDDYDGHSLKMLHRVAAALAYRVDVQFRKIEKPGPDLRRAG